MNTVFPQPRFGADGGQREGLDVECLGRRRSNPRWAHTRPGESKDGNDFCDGGCFCHWCLRRCWRLRVPAWLEGLREATARRHLQLRTRAQSIRTRWRQESSQPVESRRLMLHMRTKAVPAGYCAGSPKRSDRYEHESGHRTAGSRSMGCAREGFRHWVA